jgi:DNA-binding MarR family transcriptional regulator
MREDIIKKENKSMSEDIIMKEDNIMSEDITNNEVSLFRELSFNFRRIDRTLRRVVEKKAATTGVFQGQHRMLMTIACENEMSQADLAQRLEISPASVAVSIKKLEQDGYIVRNSTDKDNRINHLQITDKGQIVVNQSKVMFKEIDINFFKGFNENELELLQGFFSRMQHNLDQINKESSMEEIM